jgi:hypothetical protein
MTGQLVGVELRQGEYIVSVYSRTPKGVWVLDGMPARLSASVPADHLGTTIRNALDRSRVGVDELTRDSDPARPLLDLLKLPDFATYAKGTRSVEVYRDGETIEVTPQRNEGGRHGFTPIDEETQTLVNISSEQLGAAIIGAFDKAV